MLATTPSIWDDTSASNPSAVEGTARRISQTPRSVTPTTRPTTITIKTPMGTALTTSWNMATHSFRPAAGAGAPERGPRLVLFHRPEGVMAYTHSHHCWVAIAPVRGVETHQWWDAVRHGGGRAELRLADDRAMHRGDVATLTPPGDIHNHGHVIGTGPSPYSLILLGDDMYLFERKEYDPEKGTWRTLAPGDSGRSHR